MKQPTGGGIATAAPTNAYPSRDGAWILIAANSEPLFARPMTLMERPDLIRAEGYRSNPQRVANAAQLDALITDWTGDRPPRRCWDEVWRERANANDDEIASLRGSCAIA